MKKVIVFIVLLLVILSGFILYKKIYKKEDVKNVFKTSKYKEYKSGDKVIFNDENWYVMFDSSKKEDSLTLISADILFLDDEDLNYVISDIYETSKINDYLENEYVKKQGAKNFVEKNGYKARLLNMDDIKELTIYDYDDENDKYIFKRCPDFICSLNSSYATMIDTKANFEKVDVYNNIEDIENLDFTDYQLHINYYNLVSNEEENSLTSIVSDASLFIKPVINVYKSSIKN